MKVAGKSLALAVLVIGAVAASVHAADVVPVTVDNFVRAESDVYLSGLAKDALGKFEHRREPASIDLQTVIRLNRDTLYSSAVFDLDAGPVTITLPDAGTRFMSMQVINQDHDTPMVVYGGGRYSIDKAKGGCHGLQTDGQRRSGRWLLVG